MAKENLSVEEILAACRAADGGGAGAPADSTSPEAPAAEADETPAAAAAPKPASKNMSVEEMLAAARAEKQGAAPVAAAAAASSPASAAGSDGKKPSANMSVEEMLAAARGEKGGSKAAAPAATAKSAPAKSAAAPATKKVSPKAPAGAPAGPRDTSSILAAARKADKRGPMSKAEAAKQGALEKPTKKITAPPMPEKPAYAKPRPPQPVKENRRSVLAFLFGSFLAIGFFSLSAVSALWGLGLARFMFPNILMEPPSRFKVGFPVDFSPGTVTTKFKAQFGVWVVNTEYEGERQITALQSVCTHLGCTPNWLEGEQKFKCPCHGSGFYKDGINFEGPAPRPLERFAIRVADDGQIEVDKSKKFQQEMGQWKDKASYIPV